MPSVLKHTECAACGHRHHFCLVGDDLVTGREYEYVCPETARKARLRPAVAAEVVHALPQGAVALTPMTYDSPPDPARGPTPEAAAVASGRPAQPWPGAGQPQPVDPGALPEEALAQVSPATPAAPASAGLPEIAQEVREIGREMQGLAARVGDLEQKAAAEPPPDAAGAGPTGAGPAPLQEVLPEIKDLARKVGGLEQLADIVETVKGTKE